MEHKDDPTHRLEIRGTIDRQSSLYQVCKSSDETKFRTVRELAEEAIAVRSQLAHNVSPDHPLKQVLNRMKSGEAVAFLLGMTHKYGQTDSIASSDKAVVVLSAEPGSSLQTVEAINLKQTSKDRLEQGKELKTNTAGPTSAITSSSYLGRLSGWWRDK